MTTMLHEKSEGTKLLAPPYERGLLPERATSQATVSVTTLFANDAAHDEAERFADFLSEKLGADLQLRVRHWSYNELQHLRAGKIAAELAEQTDILLLVTHADEMLPPTVSRWIAGWLLQARSPSAAVCLVGSSEGTETHAPVVGNLRNACQQAQVDFFVSAFRAQRPKAETPSSPNSWPAPLCMCGVPHWGINE